MSRSQALFAMFVASLTSLSLAGCSSVLGLNDFSVQTPAAADGGVPNSAKCSSNMECTRLASSSVTLPDASAPLAHFVPSVCLKSTGRCVPLLSEDCTTITGDYTDDGAILIGSMFSTTGAQASTNLARQQSATLAVEEINAAGGIPTGATSADARPLVMVSCDESVNLMRAGAHLTADLQVPAIIGPNTSQDTLDLSNKLTIAAGTLVISPTAVASSIADLLDKGLTWQIIPTDVQRAPLMIQEINTLETDLRTARNRQNIKLSIIYRDDALGQGTRVSLNSLMLNGKPLADPINLGANVRIDPYDFKQSDQSMIVNANLQFAPDIIVLAGTAEAVTTIMSPLEQGWQGATGSRPEYVAIDSTKVPELLTALTSNDDLRHRIRGTGVTPAMRSVAVNDTFQVSYATRYPGLPTGIAGMGPAYDSTYAVAYAIASLKGGSVSGTSIGQGFRRLSGGDTVLDVESTEILAAFRRLESGDALSVVGTFGMLQWNDNGAILGGTLSLWCVATSSGKPLFQESGLVFDIQSGQSSGKYKQCD